MVGVGEWLAPRPRPFGPLPLLLLLVLRLGDLLLGDLLLGEEDDLPLAFRGVDVEVVVVFSIRKVLSLFWV